MDDVLYLGDGLTVDDLPQLWTACADDMRRWARAFGEADAVSRDALNDLADDFERSADQGITIQQIQYLMKTP